MRTRILIAMLAGASFVPAAASAQAAPDDVVVMRRVVSKAVIRTAESTAPSDQAGTWTPGEWRWTGTSTCQEKAPRTRDVQCKAFGRVVADSRCSGEKPQTSGEEDRFETCTYRWIPGQYSEYSPRCSDAGTQTRGVDCQRVETLKPVDASLCPSATKPDTQKTDLVTASCRWSQTEWETPRGCGPVTQTRTVSCEDADTRTPAGLALCAAADGRIGAKPVETQPGTNHDQCSYSWQISGYGGWKTACSATAKRDKIYSCMRSDGTLADSPSRCTDARPVGEDVGPSPCTDAVKNASFEGTGNWTGDFTYLRETSEYAKPSRYGVNPVTGNSVGSLSKYNGGGPRQDVPVVKGTRYTVSAWAAIPPFNNSTCRDDNVRMYVFTGDRTIVVNGGKGRFGSAGYEFNKIETEAFTATATAITISFDVYSACNVGSMGVVDDVSLSIAP